MKHNKPIYFLISFLFLRSLFLFIDLNEDVWHRSVCVFGLTPPPFSVLPMIPARLSGRALDWLSDEMMTLLWEAIPKWAVSDKDCTLLSLPCRPSAPHCQLRRWWLIRLRWITGSIHWFFSVLSKICIYSCIHRAYPDSPHNIPFSKWVIKDNSPYSMARQMACNSISEMSQ